MAGTDLYLIVMSVIFTRTELKDIHALLCKIVPLIYSPNILKFLFSDLRVIWIAFLVILKVFRFR